MPPNVINAPSMTSSHSQGRGGEIAGADVWGMGEGFEIEQPLR